MFENDRIRESLEKALVEAQNVDDMLKVADRLNVYNSNENERKKNESKQRLDQNVHDDELVKQRDQAAIEERHFRWQITKDIALFAWTVITGIASFKLMGSAVKKDIEGDPDWGIKKDMNNFVFRKWFLK